MHTSGRDFCAFVTASQTRLLRFGWLLAPDWAAAEDIVQAALLKTWARWDRLQDGNPELYVRRVMVNLCRTQARRRWRSEVIGLPEEPAGARLPDEADGVLLQLALRSALLALPPRQRAAVALRYFEDLSEKQTADAMGCSVGTVKSTTSRALAGLRANLMIVDASEQGVAASESAQLS